MQKSLIRRERGVDSAGEAKKRVFCVIVASVHRSVSADKLGCALTGDDIVEIKDLMQEFASRHLIPYMEQKVRELNQQISATRKGLRNQIKNLWWRKGKDDGPDSTKGSMYTFSSTESQIRILGDYAFMLHDYELALSSYRLISTDYKLDKAWKHYAGVQKLGKSGFQNATRCGLWWAEMLKARDQYKEAASVYFRICGEEPLHAAVMLEQASYCFVLTKPAMLHKFGFKSHKYDRRSNEDSRQRSACTVKGRSS